YPTKPIRMLVGFAPGGGTDIVARILAPKLTAAWNQQLVIDNRSGATGTIAAGLVARATPDGYTLLMGHASTNTIAPALYAKLPFDPYKDFVPVTLAGSVPHLVSVHPSLPVRTIKELIAVAKASPGQLTTPSSGHGSMSHIAGEVFKHTTGTNFTHVPYKGAGLSVQDLIAGQVKVSFDTTAAVMPFVKSGKLRALAAAAPKRLSSLPEVPTVSEAGVPGFVMSSWYGVFAPTGTPVAIVRTIHAEVNRAQDLPDVKSHMDQLGADDTRMATPEAFAAMVKTDIVRFANVVKVAGIRIE
ncbi:MAG TPA: tripartite tricarboxylate transporter substrate binding protein, partial [Burkholderiales bacterium]|nr:tripartite tricarboxylate transporter substrate binding protein [Burkholderiales bacterium]